MKKITILIITVLFANCFTCYSQKNEITKTGLNFGPLPVIAFDADKGLQYGALLNIFDFDDGSQYPNPLQKWYIEASFYTKGTQFYKVYYDTKKLIPGVRVSVAVNYERGKATDFYGFNGYASYYDVDKINAGKAGTSYLYTPYYRMSRNFFLAKADFTGKIGGSDFYWEAGYHFHNIDIDAIDRESINKGKTDIQKFPDNVPTLYEEYCKFGIIPTEEKNGGRSGAVRAGLIYDTRDVENAPESGLWAEAHVIAASKFLGSSKNYLRYNATFRHYVPIVKHKLTFAYRLNYQGTIGESAPFYMLPLYTVMGVDIDKNGMGGYRTVRGMLRDRVQGLDVAFYNAELRWNFVDFQLFNQNIGFSLTAFSDGAYVTRGYKVSGYLVPRNDVAGDIVSDLLYKKDAPHITAGAGLRFIMNRNFIVAFEYGKTFNAQDGDGGFYINTGYLF